jgi:adenylyltransferase and sulfurtransferase
MADPSRYLAEDETTETYVLCRLGNDSQIAVEALRGIAQKSALGDIVIKDVIGGLRAWANEADPDFPVY